MGLRVTTSRRALVIGNVNVDVLLGPMPTWPTPGSEVLAEHYELRVGGAAGNTALALAALGVPMDVVAGVGQDAMGAWLEAALAPVGVQLEHIDASTALTVGLSHRGGERTFVSHQGHLETLPWEAVERALARARRGDLLLLCGYFMLPGLRAGARGLLERARSRGLVTMLDPGWPIEGWTEAVQAEVRALLPLLDAYLPNRAELLGSVGQMSDSGASDLGSSDLGSSDLDASDLDASDLDASDVDASSVDAGDVDASDVGASDGLESGDVVRDCGAGTGKVEAALAELAPTRVVLKLGAAGALLAEGRARSRCQAPTVIVQDTIGAGDTFNAGLLAGLLSGGDWAEALEPAVRAASLAVSSRPRRYPSWEQLRWSSAAAPT